MSERRSGNINELNRQQKPAFAAGVLVGFGGGVRPTFFSKPGSRGYYFAPFLRVDRVTGERDGMSGSGVGFSAGFFVGHTIRLGRRLDGRLGAGVQYMSYAVDTSAGALEAKTPFLALDAVVGYRL